MTVHSDCDDEEIMKEVITNTDLLAGIPPQASAANIKEIEISDVNCELMDMKPLL